MDVHSGELLVLLPGARPSSSMRTSRSCSSLSDSFSSSLQVDV